MSHDVAYRFALTSHAVKCACSAGRCHITSLFNCSSNSEDNTAIMYSTMLTSVSRSDYCIPKKAITVSAYVQYIALLKRSTRYEILCVTTMTDAVQHSPPPFVHQHIHTNI
jgi:hypothetical protein